jgi:preprotein translocase subunit SecE
MAKVNPGQFVRQVRQELAKVTWPKRKETTVSTIMVLVMVAFAAVFLLVVDQVMAMGVQALLGLGG